MPITSPSRNGARFADAAVHGAWSHAIDDAPTIVFGLGPHQCPGRLSAGGPPVPSRGAAGTDHHYGSVTLLLQQIVRRGVRRDPERPPVEDPDTILPGSRISLPVIVAGV